MCLHPSRHSHIHEGPAQARLPLLPAALHDCLSFQDHPGFMRLSLSPPSDAHNLLPSVVARWVPASFFFLSEEGLPKVCPLPLCIRQVLSYSLNDSGIMSLPTQCDILVQFQCACKLIQSECNTCHLDAGLLATYLSVS